MLAANLVQRKRAPLSLRGAEFTLRSLKVFGQVGDVNKIRGGGDRSAGYYVFDLANISRPIVLNHGDLGATSESLESLSVCLTVFLQKMLNEDRDILGSLGKPRYFYFDAAEAVEKVFPEPAA